MSYDLGVKIGQALEITKTLMASKKCKKEREKIEELYKLLSEIDGLIADLLSGYYTSSGTGSTQPSP